MQGVCVFVDGSDHFLASKQEPDAAVREALEDRGYRVVAIYGNRAFNQQVAQYTDVFGAAGLYS